LLERRVYPSDVSITAVLRDDWSLEVAQLSLTVEAQIAWIQNVVDRLAAKRHDIVGLVDDAQVDAPPTADAENVDAIVAEHNRIAEEHAEHLAAAATRIRNHHLRVARASYEAAVGDLARAEREVVAAAAAIEAAHQRLRELDAVEGSTAPSADFLTKEVGRLLGRAELEFRPAGADRYEVLRASEPAHGLSEGERTAITLVHFLELVRKHDSDLHGRAIVVVDDPVSSLDHGIFIGVSAYLWSAVVSNSSAIEQLILLTHNFELFRQWDIQYDNLPSTTRAALAYQTYELAPIYRAGVRGCEIRVWPPNQVARRKSRSAYHHAFISVAAAQGELLNSRSSFDTRLEAQLLFPNVVRKLLETFMAFKRPGQMGGLSEAMAAVDQSLAESGFEGDSAALRHDLLRFANVYSHSNTPESDFLVSPEETLPAINAVLEFMSWVDPEHFKGMCDATQLNPDDLVPGFSSR
jgi:wobble nucleotide-excising tRNase